MHDTPSRLPPGPPRAPGTASRECDQWIREERMRELRRAMTPQTAPARTRIIGYARTKPEGHA